MHNLRFHFAFGLQSDAVPVCGFLFIGVEPVGDFAPFLGGLFEGVFGGRTAVECGGDGFVECGEIFRPAGDAQRGQPLFVGESGGGGRAVFDGGGVGKPIDCGAMRRVQGKPLAGHMIP